MAFEVGEGVMMSFDFPAQSKKDNLNLQFFEFDPFLPSTSSFLQLNAFKKRDKIVNIFATLGSDLESFGRRINYILWM